MHLTMKANGSVQSVMPRTVVARTRKRDLVPGRRPSMVALAWIACFAKIHVSPWSGLYWNS